MKMKKKSIYVFITASLALCVPAPGRFVFGIILVLEMNIMMLLCTSFRQLVAKLRIDYLSDIMTLSFLIFLAMLYKQLLIFISPETAIQIGFVIFIPPASSYFIGYIFGTKPKSLSEDIKSYMSHTLLYSLFALLFFLLRDIVGFGTFTYITFSGVKEIVLFNTEKISAMSFFATIPGALISVSLILTLYIFVMDKIHIVGRTDMEEKEANT